MFSGLHGRDFFYIHMSIIGCSFSCAQAAILQAGHFYNIRTHELEKRHSRRDSGFVQPSAAADLRSVADHRR